MLSDLYFQFWGERSDLILMHTQFDMMQKEGKYIILVCENEEKIIGSVMGIICQDLYATCLPFMVVENMIVDERVRRQGIGSSLLKKLEDEAHYYNCSQMILVTEKERTDACAFYETNGFSRNMTGYKKQIKCRFR